MYDINSEKHLQGQSYAKYYLYWYSLLVYKLFILKIKLMDKDDLDFSDISPEVRERYSFPS